MVNGMKSKYDVFNSKECIVVLEAIVNGYDTGTKIAKLLGKSQSVVADQLSSLYDNKIISKLRKTKEQRYKTSCGITLNFLGRKIMFMEADLDKLKILYKTISDKENGLVK